MRSKDLKKWKLYSYQIKTSLNKIMTTIIIIIIMGLCFLPHSHKRLTQRI